MKGRRRPYRPFHSLLLFRHADSREKSDPLGISSAVVKRKGSNFHHGALHIKSWQSSVFSSSPSSSSHTHTHAHNPHTPEMLLNMTKEGRRTLEDPQRCIGTNQLMGSFRSLLELERIGGKRRYFLPSPENIPRASFHSVAIWINRINYYHPIPDALRSDGSSQHTHTHTRNEKEVKLLSW